MAKKNNNISPCELSASSLDYLGLTKQPFVNEILSGKSFFEHQALTKITDSLTHQAQFSDLLLLVEGAHGAGKTSLFRQFIQTEIPNTKILSVQAEATDTLVQIQQKISIHLQDLGDANHLDENLKSLQMFDQNPILVMDSAHVLSDITLQELFRYQQQLKQQEVNLKILFFANNGMTDTLKKITDIQSDQMYVQNMPEFSPKQAESFIMHRLRNAGFSSEPFFDSSDISQLFKKCDGTPLDIMEKAAPLLERIITRKSKPASTLWIKALAGVLVISALGGGAFIYIADTPSKPIIDAAEIQVDTYVNTPIEKNNSVVKDKPMSQNDVIDLLENDKLPADDIEPATQSNNMDNRGFKSNIIEETETQITTADNTVQPLASNTITTEPLKKITPVVNEPVNAPVKKHPPKKVEEIKLEKPIVKKPEKPNPTIVKLNEMGLQNANWLRQQHDKNWTLQLLGARDPKTLLKFAQHNNLSSNTAWYKTWLSAKPYYVLVHGSYVNRDDARNAVAGLSAPLRSLKPWVKSMKSVHKAIE
ncbi:hypothetical protein MNBD_GAMMA08-2424 [hydrothermal vent metagenome]|uniref:SPOR domain-containing protein n=1 Tax=hydrothermal vent metagenome TaxID=652676 RepID=A0A3B0XDH1_9ZZZZ